MSEITFTDDAEREFWERAAQRAFSEGYVASDAANQADDITIQRRKRLGTTPPGTPPAVTAEVAKVLGVSMYGLSRCLYLCGLIPKVNMERKAVAVLVEHMEDIRAARAALGMETKEQQP